VGGGGKTIRTDLHLHRLQDCQRLSCLYRFPDRNQNFPETGRQRGHEIEKSRAYGVTVSRNLENTPSSRTIRLNHILRLGSSFCRLPLPPLMQKSILPLSFCFTSSVPSTHKALGLFLDRFQELLVRGRIEHCLFHLEMEASSLEVFVALVEFSLIDFVELDLIKVIQ
jgi:hypothetical protein